MYIVMRVNNDRKFEQKVLMIHGTVSLFYEVEKI